MIKETLEGPCGSKLHLDSTKFHPDDPGQDSPALVEYKGQYDEEIASDGDVSLVWFWVTGTITKPMVGTVPFAVSVIPSSSEYDYDTYPRAVLGDDDEPLQIAIGEYFDNNNINVGTVGR